MQNFTPLEKLSKKARKERNAKQRGTWGSLNPVTRKPANPKAYNRKKARKWSDNSMTVPFVMSAAAKVLVKLLQKLAGSRGSALRRLSQQAKSLSFKRFFSKFGTRIWTRLRAQCQAFFAREKSELCGMML